MATAVAAVELGGAAAFSPACGCSTFSMDATYGAQKSGAVPEAAPSSRRALLLAGGLLAGHAAAAGPAAAFENRVAGVELVPALKGTPYGATTPVPSGVGEGSKLRGCPSTEEVARPPPNCFSTLGPKPSGDDALYWTEPFSFEGRTARQAMQDLMEVAKAYPPGQAGIDQGGWKIVKQTDDYLYMQFESGRIGYIDDLEFLLDHAKMVRRWR